MDIWNPVSRDNLLFSEKEEGNEYDANVVDVVHDNLLEKRAVGYISKLLSKTMDMFLSLPKTRITCEITGKRVNRGVGYGWKYLAFTNCVGIRKLFLGLKKN